MNGVAAGAGANIALCCDIIVAAQSASFIQAFSKIGLIPDSSGSYMFAEIDRLAKGFGIDDAGRKVSAEEAGKMGMIYKFFPDETFAENALNIAKYLSEMPTKRTRLHKKTIEFIYDSQF